MPLVKPNVASVLSLLLTLTILNGCSWNESMNIHLAIKNGDIDAVRRILKEDPSAISDRHFILGTAEDYGDEEVIHPTVLHAAVWAKHANIVELLLVSGSDIEALDAQQQTPLHYAVQGTSPEIVTLLLDHGANVEARDCYGSTPLIVLARNRINESPIEIADILIAHGADIRATTDSGTSAFGATQGDNPGFAQHLVQHGLEPSLKDAFLARDTNLVRSILSGDQDPIADYPDPCDVLDNAVNMIYALELAVSDYNNMEPGRQAVRDNADIIELIFDWDVPCANSSSAVGTAAMTLSDPAVLEVLLRHGENPAMTIAANHFTGMASKDSTEVLHSNKPQENGVLRYVEDWMQQLDDPSPKVRKKAARILGRFGRNAVVAQEALTRLKDDQDEDKAVRDVAARSLDQITAASR